MNRGTKLIVDRIGNEAISRVIETDLNGVEHERSISITGTFKQLRLEDIGNEVVIPLHRES